MSAQGVRLGGLSISYGPYGYWAAIGLLAGIGRGSLHWDGTGSPVITGIEADELSDWVHNDWMPRPICSPWNGRAAYRSPRLAAPLAYLARDERASMLVAAIDRARSQWPDKPKDAAERQAIKQYLWEQISHPLNRWCRTCNLPRRSATVYNQLLGSGGNNGSMDTSYQYALACYSFLFATGQARTEWVNQLIDGTSAPAVDGVHPGLLANIPPGQASFLPLPLALAIDGLWWCAPHQPAGPLWRRPWATNVYPHQYPTNNLSVSLSMPTLSPPAGTTQSDKILAMIAMPLWAEPTPITQVIALLSGTQTTVETTAYAIYSTPRRAGQVRIVCYQGNRPATDPELADAREYQRKALLSQVAGTGYVPSPRLARDKIFEIVGRWNYLTGARPRLHDYLRSEYVAWQRQYARDRVVARAASQQLVTPYEPPEMPPLEVILAQLPPGYSIESITRRIRDAAI